LACSLKLGDKSGLNKKSTINNTYVKFQTNHSEEIEKVDIQYRKFYNIFWNNIQYLTNPLRLLKINSKQEVVEGDSSEGRTTIDTTSKFTLIKSFFQSFKPLLEYFKCNPIDTTEEVTIRFPKYIRDP